MPNLKTGYPGGIFDPLGFAKGDTMDAETKEIQNGARPGSSRSAAAEQPPDKRSFT